jgi:DNA repair photolyase
VRIITKNALILRDIDILKDLASENLVSVFISINATDESLRLKMEPRTASSSKRFATMESLANAGIPVGVMVAPVIPGLNDHEIPKVMETAANAGASGCGYEVVRLNGSVGSIFKDWLVKNFPDKALKVWSQIESLHGGKVNDSEWGRRMIGDGKYALMIARLYQTSKERHFKDRAMPTLNRTKFRKGGNLTLF